MTVSVYWFVKFTLFPHGDEDVISGCIQYPEYEREKAWQEVIDLKFRGREILLQTLSANFFGQRSKGAKQVRGNGALVLTNDELWFLRAYPVKEFSIPLKDVASVSLTRSHLGKTVGRDLLFVEYKTPEGNDAIAWSVCDPDNWKDAIEMAMSQSR